MNNKKTSEVEKMTFNEAKNLKKNSKLYVKGTNAEFHVDDIDIDGKNIWIVGFEHEGLKKRHHTQLMLRRKK